MKKAVLITRPKEEALALAEQVEKLGFMPIISPLLTIEWMPWELPKTKLSALIATSKQGVHAMGRSAIDRSLPFYVVGKSSGALAKHYQFQQVIDHAQTVHDLMALLTQHKHHEPFFYLRGQHITYDLAAAVALEERIAYRTVQEKTLSLEIKALLASGGLPYIMLLSKRTASTFLNLCAQENVSHTTAVCFSRAIGALCQKLAWRDIIWPNIPTIETLLHTLRTYDRQD